MVEKFQRRPVVVEAMQFTGDNFSALAAGGVPLVDCPTCGGLGEYEGEYGPKGCPCVGGLAHMSVLGVVLSVIEGDWILKGGPEDSFYRMRPGEFEQTYEPVDA